MQLPWGIGRMTVVAGTTLAANFGRAKARLLDSNAGRRQRTKTQGSCKNVDNRGPGAGNPTQEGRPEPQKSTQNRHNIDRGASESVWDAPGRPRDAPGGLKFAVLGAKRVVLEVQVGRLGCKLAVQDAPGRLRSEVRTRPGRQTAFEQRPG